MNPIEHHFHREGAVHTLLADNTCGALSLTGTQRKSPEKNNKPTQTLNLIHSAIFRPPCMLVCMFEPFCWVTPPSIDPFQKKYGACSEMPLWAGNQRPQTGHPCSNSSNPWFSSLFSCLGKSKIKKIVPCLSGDLNLVPYIIHGGENHLWASRG